MQENKYLITYILSQFFTWGVPILLFELWIFNTFLLEVENKIIVIAPERCFVVDLVTFVHQGAVGVKHQCGGVVADHSVLCTLHSRHVYDWLHHRPWRPSPWQRTCWPHHWGGSCVTFDSDWHYSAMYIIIPQSVTYIFLSILPLSFIDISINKLKQVVRIVWRLVILYCDLQWQRTCDKSAVCCQLVILYCDIDWQRTCVISCLDCCHVTVHWRRWCHV